MRNHLLEIYFELILSSSSVFNIRQQYCLVHVSTLTQRMIGSPRPKKVAWKGGII